MKVTLSSLLIMSLISQREQYGLELVRASGMSSGAVYPILHRLKREGLITSRCENADPKIIRRPVRTYYTITSAGRRWLVTSQGRLRALLPADQP